MGRALAVSKLESIKAAVNELESNLKKESGVMKQQEETMLLKHQPSLVDKSLVQAFDKKSKEILAQIPKINELESLLEIQDEDKELDMIGGKIQRFSS